MLGWERRDDRWERAIDALDPERDAHAILVILSNHVFPLDFYVAVEMAQLRTFSIPSIARLLHATGRYEREGPRRLDDTKAILSEIVIPGPHTPEGRAMIARLNAIHGHYRIGNEDFLYTLSVFVFDPGLWLERYGWRTLRESEQLAIYHVYRQIGEGMQLRDIPPSPAAFWSWRQDYEARTQGYAAPNRAVADGLARAAKRSVPLLLRPLLPALLAGWIGEDAFREALGWRRPGWPLRLSLGAAMGLRRRVLRRWTSWNHRRFWESAFFRYTPTYPEGYRREELGPRELWPRED